MLVYIEFLSRQPGVSIEHFHLIAGGQVAWSGEYADDQLVLNLGRTFRTGPEPSYLAVWFNREAGLDRIGDWDRIFKSGVAKHMEEPFHLAARIDAAGCYEPLVEPVPSVRGPYYGEYLDIAPGSSRDAVRVFFEERRTRHSELELNLLVDRIGRLGPDPRCLAVWRAPSFGALEEIVRELEDVETPVRLVSGAFYENLGDEII